MLQLISGQPIIFYEKMYSTPDTHDIESNTADDFPLDAVMYSAHNQRTMHSGPTAGTIHSGPNHTSQCATAVTNMSEQTWLELIQRSEALSSNSNTNTNTSHRHNTNNR